MVRGQHDNQEAEVCQFFHNVEVFLLLIFKRLVIIKRIVPLVCLLFKLKVVASYKNSGIGYQCSQKIVVVESVDNNNSLVD